ncbi:MAG: cytochrome c peroxidase [Saprospiraceae bacterium]|nr:cytochrome c peroxidase [Saprospiraceae bacterium]
MPVKWALVIWLILSLIACREDEITIPFSYPSLMEIPDGFPAIHFPEDNAFTQARWELGKRLFYDPVLSVDGTISCASCHKPGLAFSDQTAVSLGIEDRSGTRNTPSLANVAYQPYLLREGGVPTLEMQVLVPIQEHNEFDFNIVLLAQRLNTDSSYIKMAMDAYDRSPDAFVITRALACFERSLLSGNSAYDQYTQKNNISAMTEAQVSGMNLFFSARTNCSTCHSGFNFTNYAFENNGLYVQYTDEGRMRLTLKEEDRALFKVPGLRNIELTAPYMHDGSLQTLRQVIDHYQSGGKDHPHKNQILQPLDLTVSEQNELIEFLKALTDDTFIANPLFKY